jgi:hypothetical protein
MSCLMRIVFVFATLIILCAAQENEYATESEYPSTEHELGDDTLDSRFPSAWDGDQYRQTPCAITGRIPAYVGAL